MKIQAQLTEESIATRPQEWGRDGKSGALAEFWGIVRGEEEGEPIRALEYEAYPVMAIRQMEAILRDLGNKHLCHEAQVIHRLGVIPAGEAAIWVGITTAHRQEAFAMLITFMDRLKQEVPIWKVRAVKAE